MDEEKRRHLIRMALYKYEKLPDELVANTCIFAEELELTKSLSAGKSIHADLKNTYAIDSNTYLEYKLIAAAAGYKKEEEFWLISLDGHSMLVMSGIEYTKGFKQGHEKWRKPIAKGVGNLDARQHHEKLKT